MSEPSAFVCAFNTNVGNSVTNANKIKIATRFFMAFKSGIISIFLFLSSSFQKMTALRHRTFSISIRDGSLMPSWSSTALV